MLFDLNDFNIELNNDISRIKNENIDVNISNLLILKKIEEKINKLHEILKLYSFENENDEIHFFKYLKPKIISKLIFHKYIIEFESKKPFGNKLKEKFIAKEINKINQFTKKNRFFFQYYRSNSTHSDSLFFTRNKQLSISFTDNHLINYDLRISTSHDFLVAQFLANEKIIMHLEEKLDNLKNSNKINFKLKWSHSKVSLVELIYALHSEGVFNNGAADLKDIAENFEHIFEIDLGQYRRTFLEIRARKNDKTKFITTLNDALLKRMENSDEVI